MANRTLWPLFHYRIDLTSFEHEWYQAYRDVARLFAEQLIQLLQPDDRVWVQDFHLIPLGTELRRLGFAGRLGFFLHIPFPPTQLYATMPWHRELATDLCAYDAVGFQTPTDREHFADYALRELGAQPLEGDWLRVGERTIEVHACPIGIDVKEVERLVASAEGRRQFATIHGTLSDRALIIGVDRLDYSKGIPERLRAYQALLARYPQLPPQGGADADLRAQPRGSARISRPAPGHRAPERPSDRALRRGRLDPACATSIAPIRGARSPATTAPPASA